ncbi:MAG: restriction endonuclease subunit S [Eggerthellaceae bacterium]|nr:restriction endonuclease subunit S [Eggerthellaceae bacterium]
MIAEILNPIRYKIALNAQINGYLEELLLEKYTEIFSETSATSGTGTIADIGEVAGGATPSKKRPEFYTQEGIGWITPRDLSNTTDKFVSHGADDITQLGFDSCSTKLLPAGSILFSSRAPIGYIAIAQRPLATNQGFKSVIPKAEVGTAFVYCFLTMNKDRIAGAGSGTTFPEVSSSTMKGITLNIPTEEACLKFSAWANPLLAQQHALERENRYLAVLRDTLLPKLLSGEIDLSSIESPTQLNSHLFD